MNHLTISRFISLSFIINNFLFAMSFAKNSLYKPFFNLFITFLYSIIPFSILITLEFHESKELFLYRLLWLYGILVQMLFIISNPSTKINSLIVVNIGVVYFSLLKYQS